MGRAKGEARKHFSSQAMLDKEISYSSTPNQSQSTQMPSDFANREGGEMQLMRLTPPRFAKPLVVVLFAMYFLWLVFLAWVSYKVLSA
jgi:hypothetical protein